MCRYLVRDHLFVVATSFKEDEDVSKELFSAMMSVSIFISKTSKTQKNAVKKSNNTMKSNKCQKIKKPTSVSFRILCFRCFNFVVTFSFFILCKIC